MLVTRTLAILATAGLVAAECDVKFPEINEPQCIKDCNEQAGQSLWPDWTNDPKSPNFMKSLSYMCVRGTPQYIDFMTKGGQCMTKCSGPDQSAFAKNYGRICGFYDAYEKNNDCKNGNGSAVAAGQASNSSANSESTKPSSTSASSQANSTASEEDQEPANQSATNDASHVSSGCFVYMAGVAMTLTLLL
ncbi:hypothetical protein ACI68E_001378 [Malassezia pachydermatis]